MMAKSVLLISRQAPWAGIGAAEALDIALAAGAFDLPLSILFMDDGVLQLLDQQQPQALEQKDLSANLQALPMFGIEQLYVAQHCLTVRGLADNPLALTAERVDDQRIQQLIRQHDYVMRSEEHTSELQSRPHLVCRLLLEKKKSLEIQTLRT